MPTTNDDILDALHAVGGGVTALTSKVDVLGERLRNEISARERCEKSCKEVRTGPDGYVARLAKLEKQESRAVGWGEMLLKVVIPVILFLVALKKAGVL